MSKYVVSVLKKPIAIQSGVPFTAKESASSKGLKWTLGLVARKNIVAEEDAAVIRLMKQAGAIQIGKTSRRNRISNNNLS